MRATTLIVIGLTVILYTVVQQIRSGVYVHKPLGIAIGFDLLLWGFWERRRST